MFGGGAAYSDLAMTQQGDVAFVFERGPSDRYPYAWLSFGKVSVARKSADVHAPSLSTEL